MDRRAAIAVLSEEVGESTPTNVPRRKAKGADFCIHECFYTPEGLQTFLGWGARQSTYVSSYIHTPPAAFGKVMSQVEPRLAVGYHVIRDPAMVQDIIDAVRTTYDGPFVLADDLMCWNVSKERIQQRGVASAERVQPPPTSPEYATAKRSGEASYSMFITSGKWEGYTPPPLPER